MAKKKSPSPAPAVKVDENEIPLDQLPVELKAYKDENGYALVLKSDEKRIGNSEGRLVDVFLVRILGGPVPKVDGVHAVGIAENQTQLVEVADAKLDEKGRLFVTSATDGIQRPSATQ